MIWKPVHCKISKDTHFEEHLQTVASFGSKKPGKPQRKHSKEDLSSNVNETIGKDLMWWNVRKHQDSLYCIVLEVFQ